MWRHRCWRARGLGGLGPSDDGFVSGYREFRFFSTWLDAEAARLSMVDDRGQEYYALVPATEGRRWREDRDAALERIEAAMAAREPPGEVKNARMG